MSVVYSSPESQEDDLVSPTSFTKIETESQFLLNYTESKKIKEDVASNEPKENCNVACSRVSKRVVTESFPVLSWMPFYDFKQFLIRDIIVGITLAFVIAPKGE